ncbi:hypothetical protein HD553DRAFT_322175, partial [Filobasidium floriforme]|uniref:uncharacterized protein n=1 Tax=Filobasidium floriforme TaxID=5210 RepID=UPI001E8E2941
MLLPFADTPRGRREYLTDPNARYRTGSWPPVMELLQVVLLDNPPPLCHVCWEWHPSTEDQYRHVEWPSSAQEREARQAWFNRSIFDLFDDLCEFGATAKQNAKPRFKLLYARLPPDPDTLDGVWKHYTPRLYRPDQPFHDTNPWFTMTELQDKIGARSGTDLATFLKPLFKHRAAQSVRSTGCAGPASTTAQSAEASDPQANGNLDQANEQVKNTQTALDLATKQVNELETGRVTIKAELDRAISRVRELEDGQVTVKADLDRATSRVRELEEGQVTIKADLDRATQQVNELKAGRATIQASLDQATSRVRELEDVRSNNLDERVKELETSQEKVQMDLDHASKRVKELEEQNRLLQDEKKAAADTIGSMQSAQTGLDAILKKFRWPSDDPPALEQKILRFLSERQQAQTSATALHKQVEQLEKELQDQKDKLRACRAESSRLKTELANPPQPVPANIPQPVPANISQPVPADAPQPIPADVPQPVPAFAPPVTADLDDDLSPDKVDYAMRRIANTVSNSLPDFKTGYMQAIDACTQKPVNFRKIERFIYDTARFKEYDQDHEVQSLMGQFSRKVTIREIDDGQESKEAQNNRADADESDEEEDSDEEESEEEDSDEEDRVMTVFR